MTKALYVVILLNEFTKVINSKDLQLFSLGT